MALNDQIKPNQTTLHTPLYTHSFYTLTLIQPKFVKYLKDFLKEFFLKE